MSAVPNPSIYCPGEDQSVLPKNPVTSILGPGNERILLYYVSNKHQLALSEYPAITASQSLPYRDNDTVPGQVASTQCIQAVILRGIPTVYGWIVCDNKLILAKLSPITNFLDEKAKQETYMTTTLPSFAGATDGIENVWLYFLKRPSPGASPQLFETHINWNTTNTNQVSSDAVSTSEKSRLAVVYEADSGSNHKRTVFFQRKEVEDNKIYWFEITSEETGYPNPIKATGGALDGSPFAVTYIPKTKTLHLYYVSKELVLQRATRGSDGRWVITEDIPNATARVMKDSQITVTQTVDSAGKSQNHVFYIEKSGTEYRDHVDTGIEK